MDIFLFVGGMAFIGLGILSFINRDMLWNLYSKERGWRERNPERTVQWDERTRRYGIVYLIFGVAAVIFSFVLGGGVT